MGAKKAGGKDASKGMKRREFRLMRNSDLEYWEIKKKKAKKCGVITLRKVGFELESINSKGEFIFMAMGNKMGEENALRKWRLRLEETETVHNGNFAAILQSAHKGELLNK